MSRIHGQSQIVSALPSPQQTADLSLHQALARISRTRSPSFFSTALPCKCCVSSALLSASEQYLAAAATLGYSARRQARATRFMILISSGPQQGRQRLPYMSANSLLNLNRRCDSDMFPCRPKAWRDFRQTRVAVLMVRYRPDASARANRLTVSMSLLTPPLICLPAPAPRSGIDKAGQPLLSGAPLQSLAFQGSEAVRNCLAAPWESALCECPAEARYDT